MDDSVIAAIVAALEKDPDNRALQVHLAELLLAAGRFEECLSRSQAILAQDPASVAALKSAHAAAEASAKTDLAKGYGQLLQALTDPATSSTGFAGRPDSETQEQEAAPVESKSEPADAKSGASRPRGPFAASSPENGEESPANTADGDAKEPQKLTPLAVIKGGLDDPFWVEETVPIKLADVAGMEAVKMRLNLSFLAPMRNPEMMKLYGKSLRGGLLLYGPPGCGKTYLARATAGELGARFISVGLADVLDMYLGQSERNLHQIFENARRKAPCVLFFDEIDALGRKRSLMRESAGRDVVNQLLAEMDSTGSHNHGVFILGATNHPWDVDTALRRPGRFDRMLLVLPPDLAARQAILQSRFEKRPVEKLDLDVLAKRTAGFSGADVVHLCETAVEVAMEDSLASGKARPITKADCRKALKEVKPSTKAWFETARNYALFANEGGAYDELADYLRSQRML